jgi:hypothetical protein
MTADEKTWVSARDNYLRDVKDALKAAKYPGAKSIIEEVRQHLESRYSELPAENRTWEAYQRLITEMGPPSDYVDLLGIGKLKRRISTWKKIAIAVPLILIALVWAWDRGIIGTYNGPRIYVIPEMVGAPWGQPFATDPELVGKWVSVDFVDRISQFVPGKHRWQSGLYLTDLTFNASGTTAASMHKRKPGLSLGNWTKGWIIDRYSAIHAQYAIKKIDGEAYLFFPWLSGDVSRRYMPPHYYVMKKADPDAP